MAIEREVQIKLQVVADKGNAKVAKSVHDEIGKAKVAASKDAAKSAADERRELERLGAVAAAAGQKRVEAERRALQAGQKTLQGVLDVTQGVAQLGLMSEKSLEKFVKTFVVVQESFRVLKGGIAIITGLSEAMQAYRVATQAAVVANTALAGSQALAGGAAGGAGGRAGSGVAGGVAAGAAGGVAAGGLKGAAIAGGTFLAVGAAGLAVGEMLSQAIKMVGLSSESTGEAVFSLIETWRKAEVAANRVARAEQNFADKMQRRADEDAQIRAIADRRQQHRSTFGGFADQLAVAGGASDAEVIRNQRLRGGQELDQAIAGVGAAAGRNAARQEAGEAFSFVDQLTALERVRDARLEIVAADQKQVDLLKTQVETRLQEVEAARQAVTQAQQLVKAEESRADSAAARFGRLGAGEQQRLADISAAGGPRSRAEAEFLESTGIGGGRAQDFFAQQGRAAGADSVLGGLGELDSLNTARQSERDAIEQLRVRKEEEAAASAAVATAASQLAASLNELLPIFQQITGVEGERDRLVASKVEEVGDTLVEAFSDLNAQITTIRDNARRNRQQVAANQG